MSKIYIRVSSRPEGCTCGSELKAYSLIQDKVVRAWMCEQCYLYYAENLKGFELVFLTFEDNPILPKFLKRIEENESKAA